MRTSNPVFKSISFLLCCIFKIQFKTFRLGLDIFLSIFSNFFNLTSDGDSMFLRNVGNRVSDYKCHNLDNHNSEIYNLLMFMLNLSLPFTRDTSNTYS
jgi:hypothetical protein